MVEAKRDAYPLSNSRGKAATHNVLRHKDDCRKGVAWRSNPNPILLPTSDCLIGLGQLTDSKGKWLP